LLQAYHQHAVDRRDKETEKSLFPLPEKVSELRTSRFSAATDVYPVSASHSVVSSMALQWAADNDAKYCLTAPRYIRFYLGVWYWVDITLWAIGPFVTIIISNVAIVVRLMRFGELKGSVEGPRNRRQSQATASLGRSKSSSLSSSSSVHAARTSAIS